MFFGSVFEFRAFGTADPDGADLAQRCQAYGGLAAVDTYIGATQQSDTLEEQYGGAHVLEDLVSGKSVELRATSRGTDCYPRKTITTELLLENLNQAIMCNPRNAYQRYNAATNTTDRSCTPTWERSFPNSGNITYSGAGVLNPISNDPKLRLIGSGVPIFLCGAQGMVIGEGTQHSPGGGFGTLMVTGNLKEMSSEYLRANHDPVRRHALRRTRGAAAGAGP